MTATAIETTAAATAESQPWRRAVRRLVKRRGAMVGAVVVLFFVAIAVFAPLISPYDPIATNWSLVRKPPSAAHWFGTDEIGRDVLARIIYGARASLLAGVVSVCISLVCGVPIGLVAGYVGGRINTAIMRTVDVFYAFPSVLLAIAISGALGAGIVNSIVSLTVVFVPQITRVAESVTTGVRNMDFVEAARASGAGPFTIMRVHMLGNVLGPIFVYATGLISVSMILAAGLSFLGLGTKPPEPEWGLMLNTLRTAIYINPWVAALPGAMIFAVSICFNLLSDGMRSAMDIRN